MKKLLLTLPLVVTAFPALAAETETAYDRVMRTHTLRCGYMIWPGMFKKDVATGETSGMVKDFVETMAAGLNLKVEWSLEIGYNDVATALNGGKIDAYCFPYSPLLPRLSGAYFTRPYVYVDVLTYARADDTRFDNNAAALNTPEVTLSSVEGEASAVLARLHFPKAKILEEQTITGVSQPLMDVVTGKADATLSEAISTEDFMKSNPGKLKVVPGVALGTFSASFAVPMGDDRLRYLFDMATGTLLDNGYMEQLIHDYGMTGKLLPPAPAYQKGP